jgi:hypothetical protein
MSIARAALAALTAAALAVSAAGCSSGGTAADAAKPGASGGSSADPSGHAVLAPAPGQTSKTPAACKSGTDWDCTWQARFATVKNIIASKPGDLGVEVRDRQTGAVWRAGATSHLYWTGSTIKLALVISVLERARAGELTLDSTDRQNIADMLAWSSDDAADAIWRKGGRDAMAPRFRTLYGMSKLTFVSGFQRSWGFQKCTPTDLANLMSYVLDKLNATDRADVVNRMQHTDSIQHWGMWAAGSAQQEGNKNGWGIEKDNGIEHWLTSSVGFAGPGHRYIVAEMFSMPPGKDSLSLGAHTLSDISATLFGVSTPAPIVVRAS